MIRLVCACGRQLQAREGDAGRDAVCPICGRQQVIPTESAAVPRRAAACASPKGRSDLSGARRPWPNHTALPTCGAARISCFLGLSSLVLSLLTGIPAVVLGVVAWGRIRRRWPPLRGANLAGWGIALGLFGSFLVTPLQIGFLQTVLTTRIANVASGDAPGVQPLGLPIDEEEANREASLDNLEALAGALWEYARVNGHFPPAALSNPAGQPLLSWRVALLPYLNDPAATELYREFQLDEPWDGPNNQRLLRRMPNLFALPGRELPQGHTYYQVLTGPRTAFEDAHGQRFETFTDALEDTLLIVEAARAVPWTKPDDLAFTPNGPLPRFGGHYDGGFHAAFADGSVDYLPAWTDARTLRAMITCNGGEVVPRP